MDRQEDTGGDGGLIQARQEEARANDAAVLQALAEAGDVGLPPGQLYERVGLSERTARASLGRLTGRGLVVRDGKRRVCATPAGQAEARAALPGLSVLPDVDRALRLLPTESQRAFTRLLLGAVAARYHLRAACPTGWGGFVALGPTKTGKTTIARVVCRVLALDETNLIRRLDEETELSLWGRRTQQAGGRWGTEASPVLGEPFLCVDEVDKADPSVRRVVRKLIHGDARVSGEPGETIDVAPTLLACTNWSAGEFPPDWQRRAVMFNTEAIEPALAGGRMAEAARELLAPGALPVIPLSALRPAGAQLPDSDRRLLLHALHEGLSAEGYRVMDEQGVELLALGRSAITGDKNGTRVAMATAADYLTCARTLGHAAPVLPQAVVQVLEAEQLPAIGPGTGAALVPDLAAAVVEGDLPRRRRARTAGEDHELVRMRSEFVETLRQAELGIRNVPRSFAVEARGLRDVITRRLIPSATATRSQDGLYELALQSKPYVENAVALAERIAGEGAECAAFAKRIRTARNGLPARPPAAFVQEVGNVRSQLDAQLKAAGSARSRDELDRIRQEAEMWMSQADQIRRSIADEKRRVALERHDRDEAAGLYRTQLKGWSDVSRRLEGLHRLRAGTKRAAAAGSPIAVLRETVISGRPLLVYEPPPKLPENAGWAERLWDRLGGPQPGVWVCGFDERLRFAPSQLATWGPYTRRVIETALRVTYAQEASYERALGRQPRRGRIQLASAA